MNDERNENERVLLKSVVVHDHGGRGRERER